MCRVKIERALIKVSARFQLGFSRVSAEMCKVKIERGLIKVSAGF